MITLDTITKSIEVILSGAITTNELDIVSSYVDISSTGFAVSDIASTDTLTTGVVAVTAIPVPAAATRRQVKSIFIFNADTAIATVTVSLNNNATIRQMFTASVPVGKTLQYIDGQGWSVTS